MQIKLENINYKELKNINFEILDNKITGIVSNNLYDLNNINYIIKNNSKEYGNIKYSKRYSINKIGIISINKVNDIITNDIKLDISKVDNDIIDLLGIDKNIDLINYNSLSTTEKIKVLFLICIAQNPDTILVDCVLEELDYQERKKILKLLINLKKFKGKTIVISSIDVDLIYEFIDNIVIIHNGVSMYSKDKYSIFDNLMDNVLINKPFIRQIENMVNKKRNINLGENDNINELIKSIYREIR